MILSRWFKLDKGAEKSREGVFARLASVFEQPRPIDDDLWTELEDLLLEADVGVKTTDQLLEILNNDAKLAGYFKGQGQRVMLAAADTFRAAAIDQLKLWGERVGVPVVAQNPGSDPGSVVFDAVSSARGKNTDLLIVDTAGRLHTKVNLMEELKKIRRVLERQGVSHVRTLLVLDASTGQNAIVQGRAFKEATGLDGLVLAKLDGTAKGGVVFAIVDDLEVPVLFVGTGERLGDLSEFDANAFVRALFKAA